MKFKLKYVVSDRDRHGNVRFYFRFNSVKTRMSEEFGSPKFLAQYQSLISGASRRNEPSRAIHGSFRWACQLFMASPAFARLDVETRKSKRRIFESMWRETLTPSSEAVFGNRPLKHFTGKDVRILRDRKQQNSFAANARLKCLSPFFVWCVEQNDIIDANPCTGVKRVQAVSVGHRTWTISEIEKYEKRHPIGSQARLALALFLYTGRRISDIAMLGPQHLDDGWLKFTEYKNRNSVPVRAEIVILRPIKDILDATPLGHLSFLTTDYGKPFSIKGLGNKFQTWCKQAGIEGYSAHGLRKHAATCAAQAGASRTQLMAMFGWTTSQQVDLYTSQFNRRAIIEDSMHMLIAKRK